MDGRYHGIDGRCGKFVHSPSKCKWPIIYIRTRIRLAKCKSITRILAYTVHRFGTSVFTPHSSQTLYASTDMIFSSSQSIVSQQASRNRQKDSRQNFDQTPLSKHLFFPAVSAIAHCPLSLEQHTTHLSNVCLDSHPVEARESQFPALNPSRLCIDRFGRSQPPPSAEDRGEEQGPIFGYSCTELWRSCYRSSRWFDSLC